MRTRGYADAAAANGIRTKNNMCPPMVGDIINRQTCKGTSTELLNEKDFINHIVINFDKDNCQIAVKIVVTS